jgi:hypothetical protein
MNPAQRFVILYVAVGLIFGQITAALDGATPATGFYVSVMALVGVGALVATMFWAIDGVAGLRELFGSLTE